MKEAKAVSIVLVVKEVEGLWFEIMFPPYLPSCLIR